MLTAYSVLTIGIDAAVVVGVNTVLAAAVLSGHGEHIPQLCRGQSRTW